MAALVVREPSERFWAGAREVAEQHCKHLRSWRGEPAAQHKACRFDFAFRRQYVRDVTAGYVNVHTLPLALFALPSAWRDELMDARRFDVLLKLESIALDWPSLLAAADVPALGVPFNITHSHSAAAAARRAAAAGSSRVAGSWRPQWWPGACEWWPAALCEYLRADYACLGYEPPRCCKFK